MNRETMDTSPARQLADHAASNLAMLRVRVPRWAPALAVAAVLLTLTSCGGKSFEPFQDAPVSGHNDNPAVIINMPDGFNNVAAKCDGPNMVYTPYHKDAPYGAVSVVPNDPRCK